MLDTIPVPADSKFGAMVARRLNASRPIAPAGSLAMSGPTGTGFAPLPANLRNPRVSAGNAQIPWSVESYVDEDDGETKFRFANKILQVGYGVYNYDSDIFVSKVTQPDDLSSGSYYVEISFDEVSPFAIAPSIEIKAGNPYSVVDWENLVVRIRLGSFDGKKLINGIGFVPIIYGYV